MSPRRAKSIKSLPQADETWFAGTVHLRIWITPEDEPPHRPYLIVVADADHGYLLVTDMVETPPEPARVAAAIQNAMRKPARGAGKPRRPARLILSDPAVAELLGPRLTTWVVTASVEPLPGLEEMARDLEMHLNGRPEHPGLLTPPGVTPAMVGGVFAAAAAYYRAAPWVRLEDRQAFALRIPAQGGVERVAAVLGNAGLQEGLAVYSHWATLEHLILSGGDHMVVGEEGFWAVWFETMVEVPSSDLEAIETHGWEVAGPKAYPIPIHAWMDGRLERPGPDELHWLEAALRAIPLLAASHLQPVGVGEYAPFTTTLSVPTHAGPLQVAVRFPAGVADRRRDPHPPRWELERDEADDGGPPYDRRAMEGQMARMMAGFDEGPPPPTPSWPRPKR